MSTGGRIIRCRTAAAIYDTTVNKPVVISDEDRAINEFNKIFGKGLIKAIRYDDIGQNMSGIRYLPDWYKLTPAYKLSFSGMSLYQHITSIFSPMNDNNLAKRIHRWVSEDKTLIYCGWMDKLSIVASTVVMGMTFVVTYWQIILQAELRFFINQTEPVSQDKLDNVNHLNHVGQSRVWQICKLIISGVPIIINFINAYKRTTTPLPDVLIKNFQKGIIKKKSITTKVFINK